MTDRSTCWSLTINNPSSDDEECISLARQKGWQIYGQIEKGESGTLHYQMMLKTPQVRFSAVKKMFPRAHIEVAKNSVALSKYVNKEETREAPLPREQNKYPPLSKLWELIYDLLPSKYRFPNSEVIPKDFVIPLFDDLTSQLIEQGYMIETMCVNPQVRSCWKIYHLAIIHRIENERFSDPINIPDADEKEDDETPTQEVWIPTKESSSS